MIGIIDYDAGNLKSVEKALRYLGEPCKVTRDREEILAADKLILPGVGAFGEAVKKLRMYGLDTVIKDAVNQNKPFLGICLGMQLMFESSEESPGVTGLGLLPGKILKIPAGHGLKIPHIGWNSLNFPKKGRLFSGLPQNAYVYFVHSYYLQAGDKKDVAAGTEYGVSIDAAVERGCLFGCQFHPEKSGDAGLRILKNFAELD